MKDLNNNNNNSNNSNNNISSSSNNNSRYQSNLSDDFRLPLLGASTSSQISSMAMLIGGRTPGPRPLTRSQIVSLLELAMDILNEKDDDNDNDNTSQRTTNSSQSGNCS
jgi:hypothetical protein